MICKRVHGAGSGAGPSPGGEPATCGRLVAQALRTVGIFRKKFGGWLGVQRWLRCRKREHTHVSQPRKCLPSDCRAICSFNSVLGDTRTKFSPLFRARRRMPPCRTVETTVQIRGARRSDVGKPVWAGSSWISSSFEIDAVSAAFLFWSSMRSRSPRWALSARADQAASDRRQGSRTWSALPLPPRSALVQRGRGRIAGLSCGRSALPRLFAPWVVRGLGR